MLEVTMVFSTVNVPVCAQEGIVTETLTETKNETITEATTEDAEVTTVIADTNVTEATTEDTTATEISIEAEDTSLTEETTTTEDMSESINDSELTTEEVVNEEAETEIVNTEEAFDEDVWDQVTTEDIFEGENYSVTFTLSSTWNTGYNANVKLENTGDSTIQNWYLGFDYDNSITNIWNAEISSNDDTKYVIKNAGWNQDIAAGNSIEFGISGDHAFSGFPKNFHPVCLDILVEHMILQ